MRRLILYSVHSYDCDTAQLMARDRYPATSPDTPTAVVNVQNVLENLGHELLEVGSWLNIMGYARTSPEAGNSKSKANSKSSKGASKPDGRSDAAFIEATMIWTAGGIKLDKYKSSVHEYQQSMAGN